MNTNMNTTNQTEETIIELLNKESNLNAEIAGLKKVIKDINGNAALVDKAALVTPLQDQMLEKQNELMAIKLRISEKEAAEKNAEKEANKLKLRDAVFQFIKDNPSAAYINEERAYYHIVKEKQTERKQNILEIIADPILFCDHLANLYGIHVGTINPKDVYMFFVEAKRVFYRKRYSIDDESWNDQVTYLPFKYMETYFIDKVEVPAIDPTVINYFEQLMYSLSGGKEENKNHIEQWIVHKILNYRKPAITPDIVIVGHHGGNGKGVLQEIMKKMFPASLCGLANAKTLHGNFNNILMGKLLVFFDDQESKQIPLEVVKQLAGASSMIIERKGHDQIEVEKTHSSAFFSNVLPFRLTPAGKEGGVDRRFSVMKTNITLIESVIKHAADRGETLSPAESKDLLDFIINEKLYNRNNIAQWFQYLKNKHSYIDDKFVLKALHGTDYHEFLEEQNTRFDVVWDQLIVPSLDAGQAVPMFVIKEVLRHETGEELTEKRINAEIVARINISRTSKKRYTVAPKRAYIRIGMDAKSPLKQCSYIYNEAKTGKLVFDWAQVSKVDYCPKGQYEDLIKQDEYIFNSVPHELPPILQASSSKFAKLINDIKNSDISPEVD